MIIEALAQALEKADQSRYRIHKDTGIDQAVLSRIMNGGLCSIDTADKLCEYLGLELVPKKKAKR